MPVARPIKHHVDVGGEFEISLGFVPERDLRPIEVAGSVGDEHARGGFQLVGEAGVEVGGTGIGRTMEDLTALDIRLEGVLKQGHGGDSGLPLGGLAPDVGSVLVAGVHRIREDVVVVPFIKVDGCSQLLEVAEAGGLFGLGFGASKDGKEDGGEDGDDRDHYEQLDDGKALSIQPPTK